MGGRYWLRRFGPGGRSLPDAGPQREAKGIAYIVGDGTSAAFTLDIPHGLSSDNVVSNIAFKKTVSPAANSLLWYLVDKDGDGFYETLRIEVKFESAPEAGEKVPVYWIVKVII